MTVSLDVKRKFYEIKVCKEYVWTKRDIKVRQRVPVRGKMNDILS